MFRRSNVRAALRQPGRAGACKLPGPRIAAAAVAAEAGPGVIALAGEAPRAVEFGGLRVVLGFGARLP
jgi:hypothetical protein